MTAFLIIKRGDCFDRSGHKVITASSTYDPPYDLLWFLDPFTIPLAGCSSWRPLGVDLGDGEFAGLQVVHITTFREAGGRVPSIEDLTLLRVGRLGATVEDDLEVFVDARVVHAVGASTERSQVPVLSGFIEFAGS